MVGLGSHLRPGNMLANEVLLSVGFYLYTICARNCNDQGVPLYRWPARKDMQGASSRECQQQRGDTRPPSGPAGSQHMHTRSLVGLNLRTVQSCAET